MLVPFQMLAQLVVDVHLRFHDRIDFSFYPITPLNERHDAGVNLRKALVDLIEALGDLIEPLGDLIEPLVDLFEALVDLFEALVDLFEVLVDLIEAPVDLIEARVDSIEAPRQRVELLFDPFEPFFRHRLSPERGRRLYHRRRRRGIAITMPSEMSNVLCDQPAKRGRNSQARMP
jgi:hypothetical protein